MSVSLVVIDTADNCHFFEVRAVHGNTDFGGVDFDCKLLSFLVDGMFIYLLLCLPFFYVEIKRKFNEDISGNPLAMQKLKTACERAKRTLSFSLHAFIEIDSLIDGLDFCTTVSRVGFIFCCSFYSLFIMGLLG